MRKSILHLERALSIQKKYAHMQSAEYGFGDSFVLSDLITDAYGKSIDMTLQALKGVLVSSDVRRVLSNQHPDEMNLFQKEIQLLRHAFENVREVLNREGSFKKKYGKNNPDTFIHYEMSKLKKCTIAFTEQYMDMADGAVQPPNLERIISKATVGSYLNGIRIIQKATMDHLLRISSTGQPYFAAVSVINIILQELNWHEEKVGMWNVDHNPRKTDAESLIHRWRKDM